MPDYTSLVRYYESCFRKHGATHLGVDWPNLPDLHKRFDVMLGVIRPGRGKTSSLLDFGCGFGLLVDYLHHMRRAKEIEYTGMDLSEPMIVEAKKCWPEYIFKTHDILKHPLSPEIVDYVVMNGVLTEKRELSQPEMVEVAEGIIGAAFDACRVGLAFNVTNDHTDWKHEALFYWPFDQMARFIRKRCSPHMVIRADYGLTDYTVYVYKRC